MARLVFRKGEQKLFLNEVGKVLKADSNKLGSFVGISGRSFRDWINEKTLGTKEKMMRLSEISGVKLPNIIEEREEWWSGRVNGIKGAYSKFETYGFFGKLTLKDRIKGGSVSQQRRRDNPEYYRALGCPIPRNFLEPNHSKLLAEFFGTLLGDGGIRKYQFTITLNSIVDKFYLKYLIRRSVQLFGYKPHVFKIKDCNAVCLTYTGLSLIQFLVENGLKIGDKKRLQVDVPKWIKNNLSYSAMCVRGLMDTDGGVFLHRYRVNGKLYEYFKICFTNTSQPLLRFVHDTLVELGLTPKYSSNNKVWLYNKNDVFRYFKLIGSSNYRLISKKSLV